MDYETLDTIILISSLASIITFIAIMVIASKVTRIENKMSVDLKSEYKKHLAFSGKEKALQALIDLIWSDLEEKKKASSSPDYIIKSLKEKYESDLNNLGAKFPDQLEV